MHGTGTISKMGSGFGTILSSDGQELLFDVTGCNYEGPEEGDRVEFDTKKGWDGKPRAIHVVCSDKPAKR
ncbi:MAG: cold shock domain-containing protein [Deltaproteobacteria bacterium]|nr:cold shock domain-containing protein [Deltaproteobacteria bacterium]